MLGIESIESQSERENARFLPLFVIKKEVCIVIVISAGWHVLCKISVERKKCKV